MPCLGTNWSRDNCIPQATADTLKQDRWDSQTSSGGEAGYLQGTLEPADRAGLADLSRGLGNTRWYMIQGETTMATTQLMFNTGQTAILMADFHREGMGDNPMVHERGTVHKARAVRASAFSLSC